VPESQINRRDQKNESFYFKWATEGFMIRTPGSAIDYTYIRDTINECRKKYNLVSIGYDPYNANQLIQEWIKADDLTMVEYRQGITTMSEPTKEFERLMITGKIIHGGHPVLRWMADNAMLVKDNNDNYKIGKGKVSKDKVDGIVASIMAMGECIRFREQDQPVYIGSW
jgi:phage terminase large subunit-like protein